MSNNPKPGDKYVVQKDGSLKPESKSSGGFIGTMVESVGNFVSQITPGKTK